MARPPVEIAKDIRGSVEAGHRRALELHPGNTTEARRDRAFFLVGWLEREIALVALELEDLERYGPAEVPRG